MEQNIAQQKLCLISKDGDRFLEIDNEFHRLIFECAGKIKVEIVQFSHDIIQELHRNISYY